MNKNKGITLIALIVTTAVLLILAGISINLAIGDNGTVSKTENARMESLRTQVLDMIQNETKTAINEFGEYSQILAITNLVENYDETEITELVVETNDRLGITFEEQENEFKYVVSNKGEVTAVSEYVYGKENTKYYEDEKIFELNDKTNIDISTAYDLLAPVPLGFVASKAGKELTPEENSINADGTVSVSIINENNEIVQDKYYYGEDKIEYGLVIYEGEKDINWSDEQQLNEAQTTRDQFVWIPVDEKELNSMLVTDEKGDLYFEKIVYDDSLQYPDKEMKLREPAHEILEFFNPDKQREDLNKIINTSDDKNEEYNRMLRIDFNNLIKSIRKFGGFYIGRYETNSGSHDLNGNNKDEAGVTRRAHNVNGSRNDNFFHYWYLLNNKWNKDNRYYNNNNILTTMNYALQQELVGKFVNNKVRKVNDDSYKYFYFNSKNAELYSSERKLSGTKAEYGVYEEEEARKSMDTIGEIYRVQNIFNLERKSLL